LIIECKAIRHLVINNLPIEGDEEFKCSQTLQDSVEEISVRFSYKGFSRFNKEIPPFLIKTFPKLKKLNYEVS